MTQAHTVTESFNQILDKFQPVVYGFCYRYFGNRMDAEDCSQEIFIRIYQNLDSFQSRSKLSTWIYRITINACHEMIRSKSYRNRLKNISLEDGVHESHHQMDPHHALQQKEIGEAFQRALSQLKERHRVLIILRDLEGRSYEELSQATGLKLGTVRSNLARARYRMADLLKEFKDAM